MEIRERIWRSKDNSYIRILPEALGMKPHAYSKRLQRILCDFAREESFGIANKRLQEHYGLDLPVECIRQHALMHAHEVESVQTARPAVKSLSCDGAQQLVVEADGSMLRLVECGKDVQGKRTSELSWKECRLAAVTEQEKEKVVYAASFNGVEDTGKRWGQCAEDAGWGTQSSIHALGDGARWLQEQSKVCFSTQGTLLVDFFYVCEYLAGAAESCAHKEKPQRWLKRHKNMLKKGKINKVIDNLPNTLKPKQSMIRKPP